MFSGALSTRQFTGGVEIDLHMKRVPSLYDFVYKYSAKQRSLSIVYAAPQHYGAKSHLLRRLRPRTKDRGRAMNLLG
jgi:hypothetical protein